MALFNQRQNNCLFQCSALKPQNNVCSFMKIYQQYQIRYSVASYYLMFTVPPIQRKAKGQLYLSTPSFLEPFVRSDKGEKLSSMALQQIELLDLTQKQQPLKTSAQKACHKQEYDYFQNRISNLTVYTNDPMNEQRRIDSNLKLICNLKVDLQDIQRSFHKQIADLMQRRNYIDRLMNFAQNLQALSQREEVYFNKVIQLIPQGYLKDSLQSADRVKIYKTYTTQYLQNSKEYCQWLKIKLQQCDNLSRKHPQIEYKIKLLKKQSILLLQNKILKQLMKIQIEIIEEILSERKSAFISKENQSSPQRQIEVKEQLTKRGKQRIHNFSEEESESLLSRIIQIENGAYNQTTAADNESEFRPTKAIKL